MSRDSQGLNAIPLHHRRQHQQEALAKLQLLATLLSPTRPLNDTDREELALWIGQLIQTLENG